MISDIVVLVELPKTIRESVEGYIGCLSVAMLKGEYLQTIEAAVFQDIKVVDETHFPVDLMTDDPTVKAIIDNLHLSSEKLKEIPNSVAIVKVYAVKPSLSA